MAFEELNLVESTNGSLEKTRILTEWVKKYEELAAMLLEFAVSPYEIFGISTRSICKACDIEDIKKYKDIGNAIYNKYIGKELDGTENSMLDFYNLVVALKKTSGNDALEKLKEFFECCTPEDAKWYARILCKDLKCGAGMSAINKALVANGHPEIEVFEVGLCSTLPYKKEEFIKAVREKFGKDGEICAYCEPKYDGIRLIVSNESGKTVALTRNGKIRENVEFLLEEFDRIANGRIMAIDGELMSAESFFNVTKKVEGRGDRFFVVWDCLCLNGQDLRSNVSLHERQAALNEAVPQNNTIRIINSYPAHTAENMYNMFEGFVAEGYEGMIIKTDAPYDQTYDRKEWFKIKPVKTATLEIVGQRNGSGKYKDKLSVIVVKDKSGSIISSVGTGFDDKTID